MILDPRAAERSGSVWLSKVLAPAGGYGRRAAAAAPGFGPGDEAAATAALTQIVAWSSTLDADGTAQLRALLRRIPDCAAEVARARAGDLLDDVDFYELARFADGVADLRAAWQTAGGASTDAPPAVDALVRVLAPGRVRPGEFYLADAFHDALAPCRGAASAAAVAVSSARQMAAERVAPALGFIPDTEEFVIMRDAVAVVPAGVRIVRETPAYRLCRLDLDADGEAAVRRADEAGVALAAAEDDARRSLSTAVAAIASELIVAMAAIGQRDLALARIAFTQRFGGCVPEFDNEHVVLDAAVFAPFAEELARAGRRYTPLACDLAAVTVLTGPNMGGKSMVLATCAFIAQCVALGVPPPARAARLPLFAAMSWIGGDDPADGSQLLSSFGSEVVHVRAVLATRARPHLVLVDEFARSTAPREGRALLIGLVEALVRDDVLAIVATHFDRVAEDARVAHIAIAGLRPGALDGITPADVSAALDAVNGAMDYRLVAPSAARDGDADALALARLLGLDASIVERARRLVVRA